MPTDTSTPAPAFATRCLCLIAAAAIVFELFHAGARPYAAGLIVEPWDKLAHFAVYSGITALLWTAAAGRLRNAIIVAAVLVGALDELHQADLPGRSADAMDFLADSCAVAFTIGALSAWTRQRAPERGDNRRAESCAA